MEIKSFDLAEVKAVDSATPGEFEAVVAVFGNVDLGGDRMVKGAFADSLSEKGMPPVVWSHEWQVPPIGIVTSAVETDEGLQVKGRLFVGADEDHAVAKQVYASMKAGALKEFSFGYSVKASEDTTENGETVRNIKAVDLYEVGPTLKGMNPATRLVGVKALERAVLDEAKAGRVLSKANETRLREASQIIDDVVSQVAAEKSAPALDAPTSPANPVQTAEPIDKPEPKDTPVSEEALVRTDLLALHRPQHLI